jgi:hypothetical protein
MAIVFFLLVASSLLVLLQLNSSFLSELMHDAKLFGDPITTISIQPNQWQLFFDDSHDPNLLSNNIAYVVQSPYLKSTGFRFDQHYEGYTTAYMSFAQKPFANDPRSFLLYRASTLKPTIEKTMVLSTIDGINFKRPTSCITFKHSDQHDLTVNANVLFDDGLPAFAEHNFFIFKDTNPKTNIELRGVGGTDTTNMATEQITRGIQGFHVLPSASDSAAKCLHEKRCIQFLGKYPKPEKSGKAVLSYGQGILGQWVMDTPTLFVSEQHPDNAVKTSVFDGQTSTLWDPIRERYVLWVRTNAALGKRRTSFSTSTDFKHWSPLRPVAYPNENVSCYMINPVVLEGTKYMLSFPQCYYENRRHHMNMVASLLYSSDGGESWKFVQSFDASFDWVRQKQL